MERCSNYRGKQIRNNYTDKVDNAKYVINKNFNDMDLQNNIVRNSIEDIVNEMIKECDAMYDVINNTTLR